MTRTKQGRERRGEPELPAADEQQLAVSLITEEVQRHLAELLATGREVPPDPGYDLRLIMAVDAAMYRAGELQDLLDDPDVENIDINGSDEVFITTRTGARCAGRLSPGRTNS